MGRPQSLADVTISVPTTFNSLQVGGTFTVTGNLLITSTGSITCNDNATDQPPGPIGNSADACPITIVVTGDLFMQAGSSIDAENKIDGGAGGDITITVGGNLTLEGTSGVTPGAIITSRKTCPPNQPCGEADGGDILILVGGVTITPDPVDPNAPAIGVCGDDPTGDIFIGIGATIISDSAASRAGDIALYAGRNITVLGTVQAQGYTTGGHGGAITLDACCDLLIGDTGVVSSTGLDPGPDRVHLEGCVVIIYGLVQSTGPAHAGPQPNCIGPERPGKPANSSACVEIWAGTTLTIDSTGTHQGEINADVGFSGGANGLGWIDILANDNILINDGTSNDFVNAAIPGPQSPYLVHANMALGNGNGGVILVQSKSGSVSTFGNALQANDLAAGGDGGKVTVEAGGAGSPAGDVALDAASIEARGAIHANSSGGTIAIRSFSGDITGALPGKLDASGSTGANPGSITLTACANPISYSGTTTPLATRLPGTCDGTLPIFPRRPTRCCRRSSARKSAAPSSAG